MKLIKSPLFQQLLGFALAAVASYFLLLAPIRQELKGSVIEEVDLKMRFEGFQRLAVNEPAYKEQLADLKTTYRSLDRLHIQLDDIGIRHHLERLATGMGADQLDYFQGGVEYAESVRQAEDLLATGQAEISIDSGSLSFQPPREFEFYDTRTVNISVVGPYLSLINQLAFATGRRFYVSEIALTRFEQAGVSADLTLSFYRYRGEQE